MFLIVVFAAEFLCSGFVAITYTVERWLFNSFTLSFTQPYLVESSSAQSVTVHWLGVSAALWSQQALLFGSGPRLHSWARSCRPAPSSPRCFGLDNVILHRAGLAARSLH